MKFVSFWSLPCQWFDAIEIHDTKLAQLVCRIIPDRCPFERDIRFFDYTFHIPPLCKLNPLYYQLVSLRFKALCFLADEWGKDLAQYC